MNYSLTPTDHHSSALTTNLDSLDHHFFLSPLISPMARLLSETLTLTRSISHPNPNPLHLLSPLRRHFSIKAELIEFDLSSSDSDSADSTLKKLEDAVHGIIVRRAAPDWIQFRPGTPSYCM
ncbi:hypothetical protein AKJ16_DCAP07557 [Drosera capensis]